MGGDRTVPKRMRPMPDTKHAMSGPTTLRSWKGPTPAEQLDNTTEGHAGAAVSGVRQKTYGVLAVLSRLTSQRAMNLAFFDQIVVSGANFLCGILLARAFGVYEFGRFALAWMLVEFMGSLQFAALIQPMLNIGPKQAEADRAGYYHAVLAQQGLLALFLGLLVWAGITIFGWLSSDPALLELAAPLGAAVVAYQLYNFFRRYLFARGHALTALGGDVLRYVLQIAFTVALLVAWPNATAATGIWVVAAACAAAGVQGVFLFGRLEWNADTIRKVSARHWEFSKWLLPSAFMFWMTSQAFVVMSGFVLGAAATGALTAALTITNVFNLFLLALDNFAPVQAARALHVGGPTGLRRYIARLACLIASLTVVTAAILNVAPDYVVHVLYGDQYDGVGHLVRWLCAPLAVYAISMVLVIWAAAIERTRAIFISYAAATVFTVLAAYPLAIYGGLAGVVVGSLLVEIIRVAVLLVPLVRWNRETKGGGSQTT